jgi:hypothetical protein
MLSLGRKQRLHISAISFFKTFTAIRLRLSSSQVKTPMIERKRKIGKPYSKTTPLWKTPTLKQMLKTGTLLAVN